MNPELHFLDWDAPATVKVREFLLPQEISGPVDLGRDLIVVPTRQAGRRLREALARHCSSQGKPLISPPHVVQPPFLLMPENDTGTIARPLEVAAVWTDILMKADLDRYSGLFPSHTPSQDFLWALRTGEMIEGLRDTLADGGYSITAVHKEFGDILEEIERWYDLAELESIYLECLGTIGLKDPHTEMLRHVKSPEPPKGLERIVVAAVPDPTPLMVQKLEQLSSQVPIVILVHAPESVSGCFDAWGRPIPSKWQGRHIDIPNPEASIFLSGSPWSQSQKVLELIAREAGRFGPADVAIGVPDDEVIPFLETDLVGESLVPFNPAGKPADEHPLAQLIRAFRDLLSDGDYPAVSAFLRNRDVLEYLSHYHPREKGMPAHSPRSDFDDQDGLKEASLDTGFRWYDRIMPSRLLEELDKYQNEHLPQSLRNMAGEFKEKGKRGDKFPNLAKAIGFLGEQVRGFDAGDTDSSLRSFLQTIYEFRVISSGKVEDNDFAAVAELIDEELHLISENPLKDMNLDSKDTLEMLLWYLSGKKYYPEPEEEAIIDLEGWMELPWNDAPFLIVTGMNDGAVPKGQISDIFLPDTLRRQLNLPHDDDRLAVYCYQTTALVESRRGQGRVCFIAGKTGVGGDVLKPSRLLLRCEDSELPDRAQRLFGTPPEPPENYPSDISFLLEAAPPPDIPAYRLDIKRMPVTAFRDYLNCPFRFYLKRMLDMEAIDDLKTELDAMDFGSLVHDVLYEMACNDEMRQCENISRLQEFLDAETADWIRARLGPLPPVQVEAQIESARQRLRQAAEVQVQLVKEGWEIIGRERPVQGHIDGMLVKGKIDRIDRHRKTGSIRVLDYKTSENAETPEEAHFGPLSKDGEYQGYVMVEINGRQRRWAELQLPLYTILLSAEEGFDKTCDLGYFNLPRSVNDTGVILWEDFSTQLLESAMRCARGVVSDIRNRRFWPPATKLRYDDFEGLFPSDPALCVNTETFGMFMNRGRLL